MPESHTQLYSQLSPLERFLRAFVRIRPHEGITSVLLFASVFLILMSYYFIKPVREGWLSISVVKGLTKLEMKAYSAFGQTVVLMLVLPLYARLAAVLPRRTLITRVGLAFIVLLLCFWLVQPGLLSDEIPFSGVAFYLFVGIFSVALVAQFWAFAADVYGEERGRRLFPLVALGASSGAVVGSWLGERLVSSDSLQAFDLILMSILPLAIAIWLARWADRRGVSGAPSSSTVSRWQEPAAPENEGGYQLILKHRYLAATAALILLLNWVVASGDNVLFAIVQEMLEQDFGEQGVPAGSPEFARLIKDATTAFYGDLFFWINLIGLLMQAFLVSRLLRLGGFRLLVLTTPIISLVAYIFMAVAPILSIIKIMKVAENSSNYSINNTARQILWLPTTKDMLYQAKTTIDTMFVRLGDGLAALTVLLGTRLWALSLFGFVVINIGLVIAWLAVAIYIAKEHHRLRKAHEAGEIVEVP